MAVPPSVQVSSTPVVEWDDGRLQRREDELVVEEPLEIRVKGRPISVTMRTPGDDEELAVGFLVTEGLIARREDVQSIEHGHGEEDTTEDDLQQDVETRAAARAAALRAQNLIDVALRPGVYVDFDRLSRHVFAASSCGICGKASIDAIRAQRLTPPDPDARVDPALLRELPDTLRRGQTVFGRTGGLHAAGLFDLDGRMLAIREDVGRHNAVDKIIGHAILTGVPLTRTLLLVSGRGGFEIIQKALVAGIPILASVSAPSSLAVQLARELHLTLIGFLRGSRFVVYAGGDRLALNPLSLGERAG